MPDSNMSGYAPAAQAWFQNPGMGYFPGNPVAGFNPMQKSAWGALQSGGQMGQDFAKQMGGAFMGMVNNPYNIDPSQIPGVNAQQIGQGPQLQSQQIGQGPQVQGSQVQGTNVYGTNIGAGPQVQGQMIGSLPTINAQQVGAGEKVTADQVSNVPQVGAASMNMFQNPYLTKSIQAGMGQNNRNFMENVLPGLDTGAIGAGQSGSSRHGLAQGVAMGKLNQSNLDMASKMNERAYNQGMQNFLSQRGQNLASQTTNAANNLQAQMANQGANLQAAGMNQGDALSRALANQSAGMQGQIANQGNWLQAMMANQQTGMQGQLANQANWRDIQMANQANNMQSQLANQANNMQGQLANQQTGLQSQLANQNLWGQTALANQANNMTAQQGNQNLWGQTALANQNANLQGQRANAGNWLSGMQGNQQQQLGMMSAMPGMMGQYSQAMMAPGLMQNMIGNQQQQQQQNQLNAEMARWNWMRDRPMNMLNSYGNMLGGMSGMAGSGYNPGQGMDWGGAMAGLGNSLLNMNWGGGGYNLHNQGYAGPPGIYA